ncbi:MAG: EscU/YscU/HrcU family type III secretion system export apparatus switch protein [Deltaproteobacteria bacterium]|nr:EscU/YscU/HrcU family type III secretion system export apparatus switch protein [Deltaproteobacteria bacterium]
MADSDAGERTEAPSERALQRAREEGDIPISRDVPAVGGLFFFLAAVPLLGGAWVRALQELVAGNVLGLAQRGAVWDAGPFLHAAAPAAGLLLAAAAGAVVLGLAQTGGGTWPEKVAPDLARLWNARTVSRIVGADFWIDVGVGLGKLLVLSAAAWAFTRGRWTRLAGLISHDPAAAWAEAAALALEVAVATVTVMVCLAAADFALTRWRYLRRHRMSRADLKREHREDEGDPLLKSRRKSRARELVRNRVRVAVPTADVVVVNPTHLAVALRYERNRDRAPRVVAKGKGAQAQVIRDLANEHGVPVVVDVPLARLLYRRVKVGREVPAETFRAVAAVLAFVFRVTGRQGGRAA